MSKIITSEIFVEHLDLDAIDRDFDICELKIKRQKSSFTSMLGDINDENFYP